MKRLFVIQEHHAKRAGLHWDLRFEVEGDTAEYDALRPVTNEPRGEGSKVLRSFVIPKHRLPEKFEKLLVIQTEDHPWSYKDFEGAIEQGYGEGPVKLIFSDYIEVNLLEEKKIEFTYEDVSYRISSAPFIGPDKFLIKRVV